MKVKNGDILQIKPVLEAALALPADQLSTKGKYWLARLGRVLSGPLNDIEAARVKLVQQHGVKTETGYTVPPGEAFRAFGADFREVMDIETDVNWSPVTLTEKDAAALTGGAMLVLDQFISFDVSPDGTAKGVEQLVKS